jgi:hypothetical protein
MGFYINHDHKGNNLFPKGKTTQLAQIPNTILLDNPPKSFQEIPTNKALVCVVENSVFDAAGFCYDEREFEAFTAPTLRKRNWLLMEKDLIYKLTDYQKH